MDPDNGVIKRLWCNYRELGVYWMYLLSLEDKLTVTSLIVYNIRPSPF